MDTPNILTRADVDEIPPKSERDVKRVAQGRALKRILVEKGWQQSDLVRATGIPSYTVSRIVRGEYMMREGILRKVATALGINVEDIANPVPQASPDDANDHIRLLHLPNGNYRVEINCEVQENVDMALRALLAYPRPMTLDQVASLFALLAKLGEEDIG